MDNDINILKPSKMTKSKVIISKYKINEIEYYLIKDKYM